MRAPRASRSISACGWSRMCCQAPTSASDKLVPWSGFDPINAFNSWKKTDAAGRTFAVDTDGVIEIRVTGLAWRTEVCQQVFEEAAVDCGRALAAWADSRVGNPSGLGRCRSRAVGVFGCEPRLERPADEKALADTSRVLVKPVRVTREQMSRPNYRREQTTPEKGGAGDSRWVTGRALGWSARSFCKDQKGTSAAWLSSSTR
jgi:hypothetical protein